MATTTQTQNQTRTESEKQAHPNGGVAEPVNPVGYNELNTLDPTRALAYYSDLFGWKGEEEQTPMGPYTMFPGLVVGLTAPRDGVPAGWLPYIIVAEVKEVTRRSRELGGHVLRDCIEIPDGTFSVVRDPTGAVFGLFQKR
jgi:predicted enzyme related to lactoylglutathione lyase